MASTVRGPRALTPRDDSAQVKLWWEREIGRALCREIITILNVTLIILTLSVSRLLNLLLRLVAFLRFLHPQCWASISRWITASSSWKRFCLFVCRALRSIMARGMWPERNGAVSRRGVAHERG